MLSRRLEKVWVLTATLTLAAKLSLQGTLRMMINNKAIEANLTFVCSEVTLISLFPHHVRAKDLGAQGYFRGVTLN